LPGECARALPVVAMGVLPVKLAQAESLHDAFARVPHPRAGNRHHLLATVLSLVALSILMGRQRPADFVRLAPAAQRPPARSARLITGHRAKKPAWRPAAMCSTRCSARSSRWPSRPY
jgi:hypothetical protein